MIQKGRKFEQWDYQISLSLKSCREHFSNKINFMCGNTNIKENKKQNFLERLGIKSHAHTPGCGKEVKICEDTHHRAAAG